MRATKFWDLPVEKIVKVKEYRQEIDDIIYTIKTLNETLITPRTKAEHIFWDLKTHGLLNVDAMCNAIIDVSHHNKTILNAETDAWLWRVSYDAYVRTGENFAKNPSIWQRMADSIKEIFKRFK